MTHFEELTAFALTLSVFGASFGVLATMLYTML